MLLTEESSAHFLNLNKSWLGFWLSVNFKFSLVKYEYVISSFNVVFEEEYLSIVRDI